MLPASSAAYGEKEAHTLARDLPLWCLKDIPDISELGRWD